MQLAYVVWEPATLYNDIVWLLNQDTCQLRYKSWILSAPFAKQFQKLQINGFCFKLNKQFKVSQSPLAQWQLLSTGVIFISLEVFLQ